MKQSVKKQLQRKLSARKLRSLRKQSRKLQQLSKGLLEGPITSELLSAEDSIELSELTEQNSDTIQSLQGVDLACHELDGLFSKLQEVLYGTE